MKVFTIDTMAVSDRYVLQVLDVKKENARDVLQPLFVLGLKCFKKVMNCFYKLLCV